MRSSPWSIFFNIDTRASARRSATGNPANSGAFFLLLCCFYVIFHYGTRKQQRLTYQERERARERERDRERARARESDSVCVCEWEREGERESGAMIDNRGVRGRISSRVTCGENSWKSVPEYILCSKSLYGVLLRMYALRSSSVRVTWDTRQDFSEVSVPDNLTM